jgi:hypothetical protein
LFERICRKNGITQRLTKPRSPITTGKVARFHQTVQGELLDELVEGLGPFPSLEVAQELVDAWAEHYNTRRPHQALGMRTPAERFQPDQRHPGADGQPGPAVDAEASTTPQLRTTQQTRKEPMPEPAACPGLAARRALASAQSMGSIVAGTVQNRNGASRICGRYLRMVGAWGLCRTKSSSAARSPAGDPRIRLVNDHVPQRPGGVHDSTGNALRVHQLGEEPLADAPAAFLGERALRDEQFDEHHQSRSFLAVERSGAAPVDAHRQRGEHGEDGR